jgi:hypothetical protein
MVRRHTRRWLFATAGVATLAAVMLTLPSAGAQTRTAAAAPRCLTSQLSVWLGLGQGGAAAGSTFYPMEFSNISNRTCALSGFPGVSAWSDHQLGTAAQWDHSFATHTVNVAPGGTVHTVLQIADVANYPRSTCAPVTASSLRVYPPNTFTATSIPFSFRGCSKPGPVFLTVRPVQPGVGIPGHP